MGIKYNVDEAFFNSWNQKMAYVLGYLFADGNIVYTQNMRGKYISVMSIDRESIERIREWLSSQHRIVKRKSIWKNGNDAYLLKIGSHAIYDSLIIRGIYPNKSLTVKLPRIPKEYFIDFVRGYFDGDGCVHLEKVIRKNGILRPRKLNVIFTSGSKKFLDALSIALNEVISVRPQITLRSWTAFQLRYGTNDSVKLFRELYKNTKKGEYLERKHEVFMEFFRLHKNKKA